MSTARIIGILGGGCLLLIVFAFAATFLGLRWLSEEPEGVRVEVTAPLEVAVGERFDVVATVENTSDSTRTLVDLDIAQTYLAGLAVETSRPSFRNASHIPLDETLSHSYDLPIRPGQEAKIVLSVLAVREGDFSGDFDFCIDSEVRCLSYPARTIVGAATPAD
jgi:uncharacterized protein (DUF58 family)